MGVFDALFLQVTTQSAYCMGTTVVGKQHKHLGSKSFSYWRMMEKSVDHIPKEKCVVKLYGLKFKGEGDE